jgi:hypothetical protein
VAARLESQAQPPNDRQVFRWMNNQVRALQERWPIHVYDLICECSDQNCLRVLSLERSAFEHIVDNTSHFVVLPGHQRASEERIIDVHVSHVVVQPYELDAGDFSQAKDGDDPNA